MECLVPEQIGRVEIIGGGLAGCEAAWQLAQRGVDVVLREMRPSKSSPAHHTEDLAELVCSNSLKSTDPHAAAGLLKAELASMGSFLLSVAQECRVPAGGALAVDRGRFSALVTGRIESHPRITLIRGECTDIPDGPVIVASGPLTSEGLEPAISALVGEDRLAFFDAAAPIVETASLDHGVLFAQSRYDKGETADYLNAPMERDEYEAFITELVAAKRVQAKEFETSELFQACQPVEEVARKGFDALRFGALKPVGLTDPRTGRRPWAVVQLRAENAAGTAYNLVGFQTNLTFGEQRRVFGMIPGLENAEFARYGVMHRNTFLDTPRVLDQTLALKSDRRVRFAGQITGTEGYVEAIASGLYAAVNLYADLRGLARFTLPTTSVFGALLAYATDPETFDYQPMHVNYGIIEPLEMRVKNKRERYAAYSSRSLADVKRIVESRPDLGFPLPGAQPPFVQ